MNNIYNDKNINNWTAINYVKIACFVLIIVAAFITLNRANEMDIRENITKVGFNIIAYDIKTLPPIYLNINGITYVQDQQALQIIRGAYMLDFLIIAFALIIALALFIILLMGAGRRFGVPKEDGVFLSKKSKPFLDIRFLGVFIWSMICLTVTIEVFSAFWRNTWAQRDPVIINIFLAILAIMVVIPVLLWSMSVAKHAKAGLLWKSTLIYYIPNKIFSSI